MIMEEDKSIDYSVAGSGILHNEDELEVDHSVDINSENVLSP